MFAKTTIEAEGASSFDPRVRSRVLVRCSIEGPVIRDVSFFIRVFHLSCCQSLGISCRLILFKYLEQEWGFHLQETGWNVVIKSVSELKP